MRLHVKLIKPDARWHKLFNSMCLLGVHLFSNMICILVDCSIVSSDQLRVMILIGFNFVRLPADVCSDGFNAFVVISLLSITF